MMFRSIVNAGFNFDGSKFKSVKNKMGFNKPNFGFWGCQYTEGQETAWEQWCSTEMPEWLENKEKFDFTLAENARVLTIDSLEDMKAVAKDYTKVFIPGMDLMNCIDWETLSTVYDAVIWTANGVEECRYQEGALSTEYIDIESICIFNPDVVVAIDTTEDTMKKVEEMSLQLAILKNLKTLYAEFESRQQLNMYTDKQTIFILENLKLAMQMVETDTDAANIIAMSIARNIYMM